MKVKFDTRHLGEQEIDFAILTPAMQEYIVRYGLKQTVDDAGADPKKAADGSRERLDAILAGQVPAGGGGRLTDLERATRDVVEAILRRTGVKSGEAVKMARDPEAALRKAFPADFETIMVKVAVKSEALAAARKTAIDIEL